ncbi:MAG: nucleoid occlusion factor SlmA [Burkholderiaceae bacterium]|nr:nucleoid occlusion factor SlmA [Burkholderiaceae bacterium]
MAGKAGERKHQILQMLAEMLEQPHSARITTAALAGRLQLSEAALYRHFASKAQMFEGLFEFIEASIFSLVNQIAASEPDGVEQARQITLMLLTFARLNRGMTRVLTGDALVNEDARLQERAAQLTNRIDASLRQALRGAITAGRLTPSCDASVLASLLTNVVLGGWLRFAQSGWQTDPTQNAEQQLRMLLGSH